MATEGIKFIGLDKSIEKVSENIGQIVERRKIQSFALAASFAVKILNRFRANQSNEKYWENRTQQAFQRVFSGVINDSDGIGFFIAHGVDYGIYLELANFRKHAALRPLAEIHALLFRAQLRKIW